MNTKDNSLQARLTNRLEKWPERRAITFYNSSQEFSWYTFEQFYNRAAGYAARLADYGLSKGDTCVIVLPSGEFAATAVLATLLRGAMPLLIAPPVLHAEAAHSSLVRILKHVVGKTKPPIVIWAESMLNLRQEMEQGHRKTHFLFGEEEVVPMATADVPYVFPAETDVAAMQLTSGTTGFPKICVWKQRNVLAALDGMVAAMGLNDEDVCLNWTPLYHDMGLVNNFLLCLTSGVPLVMLSPHDFVKKPALWLQGLADTGSTITWSPNFGFAITAQRVRERDMEGVRLDGVRGFWNAAERIHYDTMCTFYERFAPYGVTLEALKTNFGCAENVGGATFSDPDGAFLFERVDRTLLQEKRVAQPITNADDEAVTVVGVGRPYPGMDIKILSRSGRPVTDGHVGEIALDSPSRMEGYLHDAMASKRAIKDGLLRTGDLGYMRTGELFWVGRTRERIAVRGKKLDPSDFEPILLQVPGLRHGNFAVFGVDDKGQGTQRIVVVAEVRDPASSNREEIAGEIRDQAMQRLGVSVSEVVLVQPNTLTKTSSGKRRHRYFRKLYEAGKLKVFDV